MYVHYLYTHSAHVDEHTRVSCVLQSKHTNRCTLHGILCILYQLARKPGTAEALSFYLISEHKKTRFVILDFAIKRALRIRLRLKMFDFVVFGWKRLVIEFRKTR